MAEGDSDFETRRIAFHPDWRALISEAHARPATALECPVAASRVAMLCGPDAGAEFAHVSALCDRLGVERPEVGRHHFAVEAGAWRLVWERHTELSTFTFFAPGLDDATFGKTAISFAPADWLAACPGQAIAAAHIAITAAPAAGNVADLGSRVFASDDFVVTETGGGAAYVLSDFRPDKDGFTRFLVFDRGTNPAHRGRLVQKLLEIETYRLASLLALPLARAMTPEIGALEEELAELTDRIVAPPSVAKDRELLMRLSTIAARSEALGQKSSFRLSAARAYYRIVLDRIESLREERVARRQRIGSFMDRRLGPAMRTCEATEGRRRDLADRVGRAGQLLLARIEVAVEEQNQAQLRSLDRRARSQLRLQQTVEALSIVAVTYYGAGLTHYLAEGLAHAGAVADIAAELSPMVAAPIIALASYLFLRRARRALDDK